MIFEFKLNDKLNKIVLDGFPKSKELDYFVKTINASEMPEEILKSKKYVQIANLSEIQLQKIKNQYEKYLKAILSNQNEIIWVFSPYTLQKITFELKQFKK